MAGSIGSIIEFLVGFFLADIVVGAVGMMALVFLAPYVGVAEVGLEQYLSVGIVVIKAAALGLLFFVRKMVAIGWLAGILFDVVVPYVLSAAGVGQ